MKDVARAGCASLLMVVLASTLCICKQQIAMAATVQHHSAPVVSAPSFVQPQMAVAPVSAQGGATAYGTFGNRTLGQSFVPSASTFGGGIQTGPSGNFLYAGRVDGSAAFATPWRQIDPAVLAQAAAANGAAEPAPAPLFRPNRPRRATMSRILPRRRSRQRMVGKVRVWRNKPLARPPAAGRQPL